MKRLIIIELVAILLTLGFIAGQYVTIHRIADVEKTATGYTVTFENGTGHYYEY